MDKRVTVPLTLLEDIFRLLDYLDPRYGRDSLHFQKSGYSQRLEHENTLWGLWIKINQLQTRIMDTYLLTIGDITEHERRSLDEWVARGYSVYDNPYSISNASGSPMDFINGCRVGLDMDENPSHYFDSEETERADDDWVDDELPWGDDDILKEEDEHHDY